MVTIVVFYFYFIRKKSMTCCGTWASYEHHGDGFIFFQFLERADFYNDKRSLPSSLIYDTQVTSKKMEEVLNSDNLNFNDKNYFWNKEGWQYYNLTYRLWLWLLYHHLLWTLLLIFQFMRHLWNTMLEPRLSWFQGDSQPTGGLRYLSAPR